MFWITSCLAKLCSVVVVTVAEQIEDFAFKVALTYNFKGILKGKGNCKKSYFEEGSVKLV